MIPASANPCSPRIWEMSTTHNFPSLNVRIRRSIIWTRWIMKHAYDRSHIGTRSYCFGLLRPFVNSKQPRDLVERCVIPGVENEIHKTFPSLVSKSSQFDYVLLLLPFRVKRDRNHVARAKLSDVQLDFAGSKFAVKLARSHSRRKDNQPVIQMRNVAQPRPPLVVRPESTRHRDRTIRSLLEPPGRPASLSSGFLYITR